MFASRELDYDRGDAAAQQRLVAETFAGLGGEVPSMLAGLAGLGGFYLDAIAQVRMDGRYTSGRVALLGDAAYGIMRGYAKIAGTVNAGRFMAPRTALGLRARNWFLRSRAFGLMMKYTDNKANDIDLADYPAQPGAAA